VIGLNLTAILDVPELAALTATYLLYRIRSVLDGRGVALIIDEAHKYIKHAPLRDSIEDLLGTIRKLEGIIYICTQQPEHLLIGSFGVMMVNQCLTKIALPNDMADKHVYCDIMGFTAGEYHAVHEGMPTHSHQFLIKRPEGESAIIDFDLSSLPEYLKTLSWRATSRRDEFIMREAAE